MSESPQIHCRISHPELKEVNDKYNRLLEFVKEISKAEPESFNKYPQAAILINNAINILEKIGGSQ